MTALDFRSLMIIHVVRGTFRQQKFLEPLPGLGHPTRYMRAGPRRVPRVLDAAGAQPGPKGLRDVALLRLLHDLGLRRSEAVRLDVEDVDLPGNRIFIPGRGRSPKEPVSLPEPTRAALAAWLEARGSEPGPLFINFDRAGKGQRLTGAAVYHIVGWLGAKAGLTVRPHGLRHLAITTALERTNGDVRAVATFSRHKDLRTLSRYRDNRPDLAGKVASLVAAE